MRTRKLSIILTTVGLMAVSAVPATAAPPDRSGAVERVTHTEGFFYGEDGILVFTGPPWEEGCLDEGFTSAVGVFVNRGDGSTSLSFHHSPEPISVYEGDDPFALLDAACGAVLDDDPTTAPVEPIATGSGVLVYHQRIDSDGVLHVHNSVRGRLVTTDGKRAHVTAFAAFTVTDGILTLDRLGAKYTG